LFIADAWWIFQLRPNHVKSQEKHLDRVRNRRITGPRQNSKRVSYLERKEITKDRDRKRAQDREKKGGRKLPVDALMKHPHIMEVDAREDGDSGGGQQQSSQQQRCEMAAERAHMTCTESPDTVIKFMPIVVDQEFNFEENFDFDMPTAQPDGSCWAQRCTGDSNDVPQEEAPIDIDALYSLQKELRVSIRSNHDCDVSSRVTTSPETVSRAEAAAANQRAQELLWLESMMHRCALTGSHSATERTSDNT
jgi:hypothetical protein